MNGLFSWENNDGSWQPFMPQTHLSPLAGQSIPGLMGSSRDREQSSAPPNVSMPTGMPPQGQAPTGGVGKKKRPSRNDETAGGSFEGRTPDFSGIPNYTGANPWDAGHYEGMFVDPNNPIWGEIGNGLGELINPVFDPSNYEGLFSGGLDSGNPVFNPDAYQGTFYNPDDPFGMAGNAPTEGGGLLGSAGKILPWLQMGKGIYGLTQGSGGKGGADLASGIGAYFVPAFGAVKSFFDVGTALGEYAKSRGRQYDYYHPYLNSQFQGANGSRIMDIGWTDSQSDAAGAGNSQSSYVNQPTALEQFNTPGLASRMNKTMVENDGNYYYITDIPQYLGLQNYDDYSGRDEISSLVGMGGVGNGPRSGLMSEEAYNSYLNDAFINNMLTQGVNFDSPFVQQAQHGMFNGQDVMGTTWNADNANRLVKMREMEQLLGNNGDFMDTSKWLDWKAPEIPQYVAPEPDPDMQGDSTFYGM